MRFQGKVAIVTGGTKGIGRAIVLRLASEGATVACCSRRAGAEADDLIANVRAAGGEAFHYQANITDQSQVTDFINAVEERFGKVDILVNNAGGGIVGLLVDIDQATIGTIVDKNLKAPIIVTQMVLKGMIERRYGKIISISSEAGKNGTVQSVTYSACKGGINAFTKGLARELAPYNINVNCVSPGITATEGIRHVMHHEHIKAIINSIPLNRLGEPEEIAAAVAFLASDEASYIPGQTLSVGGGLSMC
jgi:2-hydroxycyclohexanecarboxyl-CoA dehydrogenase